MANAAVTGNRPMDDTLVQQLVTARYETTPDSVANRIGHSVTVQRKNDVQHTAEVIETVNSNLSLSEITTTSVSAG
jgi:hypothetical protein